MHEHTWKPAKDQFSGYSCDCGATGYRRRGEIVAHKQSRDYDKAPMTFVGAPNMKDGGARRGKRSPGSY